MQTLQYDAVIIGAGAGGIATALAAARLGVRTLLVEQYTIIGGTAVNAGVSIWEPGVSGTGISRDIYHAMSGHPATVGIYCIHRHCCWPSADSSSFPGALLTIDPTLCYKDTLRRYGTQGIVADKEFVRRSWHGVPFEPSAFSTTVMNMLRETGCCQIMTGAELCNVSTHENAICNAIVQHNESTFQLNANYWVDCSGDAVLCAMAGCDMMSGTDGMTDFNEPDAPALPSNEVNAISLIYRVSQNCRQWIVQQEMAFPACWWQPEYPCASIAQYPNGDFNINMLPTMAGADLQALGYPAAYQECVRRVQAHWTWLQQQWPDFRQYGISWIAPRLGVREGPRVNGEYILTEHDLLAGISQQPHDDIIAIADHAIDMHGATRQPKCGEVREPYGIPFRCLQPKGWDNLLIACRGASFSHIAAASCRLTRTLMQLGQAAGTAIALAMTQHCLPRDVASTALRCSLAQQGVILDYRQLPGYSAQ